MSDDLVAQFRNVCTVASYLASKEGTICDARKLGIDLRVLAKFKYLMPDEISFGYGETQADTVFGNPPDKVLLFYFNDKNAQKRSFKELPSVINRRIARFEASLEQFVSRRRDTELLDELCMAYMPQTMVASGNARAPKAVDTDLDTATAASIFKSACSDIESLGEIKSQTDVPAREAKYGPMVPHLAKSLGGVSKLWSHQSRGISFLEESQGHHLVVSTPTASGKSLIFHSLVRHYLDTSEEATAMFIYPTKALAQDQLRSFNSQGDNDDVFTFDGDTDFETRKRAQRSARVLLVNPDILHTTILPNWSEWCRFLCFLKYVVIDELHYYGGIFGANVALVLRRLRRLCAQLGSSSFQFICCSATLKDPKGFMATITGIPQDSILALTGDDDGSPSGRKKFVFCTTNFMTANDPSSGRYHPIQVTAPLMINMVRKGLRVIAFCRYRRECELLLRAIYETEENELADSERKQEPLNTLIRGYRGGYTPQERREIESEMFNGRLRGIVATTALEVGIDIGNLDAAIITGFPHSIASFRQQVGRVGRRQRDSLVVYVADGSVLNQAYASDPKKVLHGEISDVPVVLHESLVRSHLQAAAYEQALEPQEIESFFPACGNIDAAELIKLDNGTLAFGFKPSINLRKAEEDETDALVIDVDTSAVIESVEYERVYFTLYEGAIFFHQGKTYLVLELDSNLTFAKVRRTNVKWITRQRDYTDVDPYERDATQEIYTGCSVNRGSILVARKVFGYFKVDEKNRIIDSVEIDMPPYTSIKYGLYINIPVKILRDLSLYNYHTPASIHASEHLIVSVLPMFVAMAPGDVGTECKALEKEVLAKKETQRHRPARLIFYEKYGGKEGTGILLSAYRQFGPLLERACDVVDSCSCSLGCGSCIGSGYCEEQNAVLSKRGAQLILRSLLGRSLDGLPVEKEPNLPSQKITTVVPVGAPGVYKD